MGLLAISVSFFLAPLLIRLLHWNMIRFSHPLSLTLSRPAPPPPAGRPEPASPAAREQQQAAAAAVSFLCGFGLSPNPLTPIG